MSSNLWNEDEQRVVSMECSDADSDFPSITPKTDPLAAWETVDEDGIEKDQVNHKFDLSNLFNFALKNGNGSGSGYDDQASLDIFATGTSQLTTNIGTFNAPIFQDKEAVVVDDDNTDVVMQPIGTILNSPTGAVSTMSTITSDSLLFPPGGTASVASALPKIRSRFNSPALSPLASRGVKPSPIAAAVASLEQTGVHHINLGTEQVGTKVFFFFPNHPHGGRLHLTH